MDTSTVLGLGSGAVVIVPEVVEKASKVIEVPIIENPGPSIMLYDLTGGAYNYIFTVGDLITTLAICSTFIFLSITLYRAATGEEPKRRKDDN